MNIAKDILQGVSHAIKESFELEVDLDTLILNETKKEFEGDFTFVTFPLVKKLRQSPEQIGTSLGDYLVKNDARFSDFNVIKGFLNLSLSNDYWLTILDQSSIYNSAFNFEKKNQKVLVEFSSPNTNKPLHLGHIRNILLGWSMSEILKYTGVEVLNTQIINDRGIAVCKSMYAWLNFGNNETPESSKIKGDHFVGKYYVAYNNALSEEYANWQESKEAALLFENSDQADKASFFKEYKNDYFNENSVIGKETKEMLKKWEAGDDEVIKLWKKMNDWVYSGFDITYNRMGVSFDTLYYESDTYLLGRDTVNEGLDRDVFYKEDDGSVWIDLEDEGLDKKLVLRSDGTAVYMTQDIGTAMVRYKEHQMDSMIYVVGNEQEYHFQVLFKILAKLGEKYSDRLHHLSYGMVDLPTGRMKSREGTVVDADDLMEEVIAEARANSLERGELDHLTQEELDDIYYKIGLGALKYFILRVNAKKGMTFDPSESLDMQGQTGPYIQNAYVRIQSVLRRVADQEIGDFKTYDTINQSEKELLRHIIQFKATVQEAANNYDPSNLANYAYGLAKLFHKFYHDNSISKAESDSAKAFRIELSKLVAEILKRSMNLLGVQMPQYM